MDTDPSNRPKIPAPLSDPGASGMSPPPNEVVASVEPPPTPQRRGFLSKLGLDRPELRAWAMYDFGNSAFMTVIITAIFPIYYSSIASAGVPTETANSRFSIATTGAMIVIAAVSYTHLTLPTTERV